VLSGAGDGEVVDMEVSRVEVKSESRTRSESKRRTYEHRHLHRLAPSCTLSSEHTGWPFACGCTRHTCAPRAATTPLHSSASALRGPLLPPHPIPLLPPTSLRLPRYVLARTLITTLSSNNIPSSPGIHFQARIAQIPGGKEEVASRARRGGFPTLRGSIWGELANAAG
jgi:hypothetical protein